MSKFLTVSSLVLSVFSLEAKASEFPLQRSVRERLASDPTVCREVAHLQRRIDDIGRYGFVDQTLDINKGDLLPVVTHQGHLEDEVAFRSEQPFLQLVTQTSAYKAQMEITEILDAAMKRLSHSYAHQAKLLSELKHKQTAGLGFFMSQRDRTNLDILKGQRNTTLFLARQACREIEEKRAAAMVRLAGVEASRTSSHGILRSLKGTHREYMGSARLNKLIQGMTDKQLADSQIFGNGD